MSFSVGAFSTDTLSGSGTERVYEGAASFAAQSGFTASARVVKLRTAAFAALSSLQVGGTTRQVRYLQADKVELVPSIRSRRVQLSPLMGNR